LIERKTQVKSQDLFRETLSRGGRKYSGKKETSDAPRDQRYQSLLCKPNKRDHDYNEKDQKEELEKERNRGKNKVGNSGKDFPEKPEWEKEDFSETSSQRHLVNGVTDENLTPS
jgi:N-acetylmuramoyl-L-alanine amidase CwlA